jgi:hypothetical protein
MCTHDVKIVTHNNKKKKHTHVSALSVILLLMLYRGLTYQQMDRHKPQFFTTQPCLPLHINDPSYLHCQTNNEQHLSLSTLWMGIDDAGKKKHDWNNANH